MVMTYANSLTLIDHGTALITKLQPGNITDGSSFFSSKQFGETGQTLDLAIDAINPVPAGGKVEFHFPLRLENPEMTYI